MGIYEFSKRYKLQMSNEKILFKMDENFFLLYNFQFYVDLFEALVWYIRFDQRVNFSSFPEIYWDYELTIDNTDLIIEHGCKTSINMNVMYSHYVDLPHYVDLSAHDYLMRMYHSTQ